MDADRERDALIGALIGLARATFGDTKPDERTWRLMAEGLAVGGSAAGETLRELRERVQEEKKRLVPRCSMCASPCGRNDDYDLALLRESPAEVRALKTAILTALRSRAAEIAGTPESGKEERGRSLAKALFALGEDREPALLRPIPADI